MPELHLFSWVAFVTFATSFLLAIIIFAYGKTRLQTLLAYFNCACALWAFFVFLATLSHSPIRAYTFWVIAHGAGFFLPIIFFHAVCIFCNSKHPKLIRTGYIYVLLFNVIQLVDRGSFLYKSPEETKELFDSIYFLQFNILNIYTFFIPWFAFLFFALYLLFKYYQSHKTAPDGTQALIWTASTAFGFLGGCSTFLPMSGINFYPVTMIFVAIYAVILTYSIFRHQFMNIRVVFATSVLYSILIAAVSALYLVLVVSLENLFRYYYGYRSPVTSVIAAFVIGIIFFPLRNTIQAFLDRKFFSGTQVEIAQQNKQLKQSIRRAHRYKTLVSFINTIMHEIKNPLTVLQVYSMRLPEELDNKEFLTEMSAGMNQKIRKIYQVIEDLKRYCQPLPLNLEEADIIQVINEAVDTCKKNFPDAQVSVYTYFHAPNEILQIDPGQIQQALENVIRNAFESMPEGGQLWVGTEKKSRYMKIFIKDTGCGIDADDIANVFDPFYRLNKNSSGLGLSVVQGIIENHSGKIFVESAKNGGTEITIELPTYM